MGHPAATSLEEIRKASRRAKDLVHQILTFSRQAPRQPRVCALRPLVEESVRLLRAIIPAGVRIDTAFAAALPEVLADPTQIQQVIVNLCTNSWQAMPTGAGRIEIRLDGREVDTGDGQTLPPGRYACLSVSDNGEGMDESTLERIFEPFFSTLTASEGTGLGLAVVHGIVKAHHGEIAVRSTPGEGTTFELYFPAAAAPAEAASEPAAASESRGRGQHVLYVDDDEALVYLVGRMLDRFGYRVRGMSSATEALELLRADANEFDLVVTDFNMPVLSGLDVAREIRRIRPGLPVVLTSGYISDELRAQASQAGIRELIYKPNSAVELCEALGRLV